MANGRTTYKSHKYKQKMSDSVSKYHRENLVEFATKWDSGELKFELSDKGRNLERLRKAVILIRGKRCEKCSWEEINPVTGKIPVQLHHKDGNHGNNTPSNLEILCPNCHSLTGNFMALNKGTKKAGKRY